MFTFTIRPDGRSSTRQLDVQLKEGFSRAVQAIRRRYGRDAFEFMAVTELTKAGTPHLHVLQRGAYVPQAWLSKVCERYGIGRIVHVRAVERARQGVRYVTKYLTKELANVEGRRRVWCSRRWLLEAWERRPTRFSKADGWTLERVSFADFYNRHQLYLSAAEVVADGWTRFWKPGMRPPPLLSKGAPPEPSKAGPS